MFPCASCERYLQQGSEKCPFCGSPVASAPASTGSRTGLKALDGQRLSRAASYAVRAALVAVPGALLGCSDAADETATSSTSTNSGSGSTTSSGGASSTGDASASSTGETVGSTGSGGTPGTTGADNGQAGEIGIPIYGGPFPDMMQAKV